MGINVRLKPKAKKDGSQRLYLDVWHGRRWHEQTSLRIQPGMTQKERESVMAQAAALASNRWVEILNEQKAATNGALATVRFIDFYKLVADTKSDSTKDTWYGGFEAISAYAQNIRLHNIDTQWLRGLVSHLQKWVSSTRKKVISQNTQASYFAHVRATIWQAYRDELISDNPAARVRGVAQVYPRRKYLKEEEILRLEATPMIGRDLKIAVMFNLYMGLRVQDLIQLTWGCIEVRGDESFLVFEAEKDDDDKYIPIPPPALFWLPERNGRSEECRVFHLYGTDQFNRNLQKWAEAAGIRKDITSHVVRHTMAVQALDHGLDTLEVKAKLGQKSMRMVEHYAKISNKKMRDAAKKFPCLTQNSR